MNRARILLPLALILAAGTASATDIGVGVFGGASIPVVQDDTGSGTQFGVRVPVNVVPLLTLEPYFAKSGLGDVTETFGAISATRTGFDVTAFGVNAALGGFAGSFGLHPYVGIASYKLSRPGSADISKTGYNFGLSLGFSAIPKIGINLRGELNMVDLGTGTSRKFANILAGVTYKLFPMVP